MVILCLINQLSVLSLTSLVYMTRFRSRDLLDAWDLSLDTVSVRAGNEAETFRTVDEKHGFRLSGKNSGSFSPRQVLAGKMGGKNVMTQTRHHS